VLKSESALLNSLLVTVSILDLLFLVVGSADLLHKLDVGSDHTVDHHHTPAAKAVQCLLLETLFTGVILVLLFHEHNHSHYLLGFYGPK
jgi:hypothetical protein